MYLSAKGKDIATYLVVWCLLMMRVGCWKLEVGKLESLCRDEAGEKKGAR
jgi:hypothetical protein